jgi:hypothetical protein
MRFAAAYHTELAMLLSVLWAAVSLAAEFILGCLPIDVSQICVVGEIFSRFQEGEDWCSHLETFGSRVRDLILGPVDDRVHLVIHLEEAAG